MKVLPSALLLALLAHASAWGQGIPFGETVVALKSRFRHGWVSDNSGLGTGSDVWSCEHIYVLTEQVVNAGHPAIEPGTVVLGMSGEGRWKPTLPWGLVLAASGMSCTMCIPAPWWCLGMPIWWRRRRNARFNFRSLATPMELWAWMTGAWGGVAGGAPNQHRHLDMSFWPHFHDGRGHR